MMKWDDSTIFWISSINICKNPANFSFLPVTPHPPRQVVAALLRLHKDDGFIFFLSHDLFHQLNQSDGEERENQQRKSQV